MNAIRFRLKMFTLVLLIIMVGGTLGFMSIEDFSLLNAVYFTVVTIATVGYGDIHPVTPIGKMFTLIIIIGGAGTFLGVIANATELLLIRREEQFRLQKLHIVVSLFFSELGTRLLKRLIRFDPEPEEARKNFIVSTQWRESDFSDCEKKLKAYSFKIDARLGDLNAVSEFLEKKGDFLLRLMANPLLSEEETFTEILRSVVHLRDEFLNRDELDHLPDTDIRHIGGDMKRVYKLLAGEWFLYMKYMKANYPYLFSLAVRTNPFDPNSSAVVRQ